VNPCRYNQAQGRHDRLRSGVGKAHQLGGRHHLRDSLRHLVFQLCGQGEHPADIHALARRRIDAGIGVTQDARSETHAVVDVFVAVQVPQPSARGMVDVDGFFFTPEAEVGRHTKRQHV
jgi:hypothetical protein